MIIEIRNAVPGQEIEFAELRARAMRQSLEAVNRYDDVKVRRRLLDDYIIENTKSIYVENKLVGFYSTSSNERNKYINHIYLEPNECGKGYGTQIIDAIKSTDMITIRLNALKLSRANGFYLRNGFTKVDESEFDNIYEFDPKK